VCRCTVDHVERMWSPTHKGWEDVSQRVHSYTVGAEDSHYNISALDSVGWTLMWLAVL